MYAAKQGRRGVALYSYNQRAIRFLGTLLYQAKVADFAETRDASRW